MDELLIKKRVIHAGSIASGESSGYPNDTKVCLTLSVSRIYRSLCL